MGATNLRASGAGRAGGRLLQTVDLVYFRAYDAELARAMHPIAVDIVHAG